MHTLLDDFEHTLNGWCGAYAMDGDRVPQNTPGVKRPRTEAEGLAEEGALADAQEDPPPSPLQKEQPHPARGKGRQRHGENGCATNLAAFSGISPLPRQHPRLANTDLPGCIVRQDFHCAVLSDVLGQTGADQCLSFHPNGLAVVQLAPTHPAVSKDPLETADFAAGGCNILESAAAKGKKKKGALQLHPTTVLCGVTTRSGTQYKVCTGIFGELIQANAALADNPGLMSEDPLGRGWLAIVRLKPRDLRRLQQALGVVEER